MGFEPNPDFEDELLRSLKSQLGGTMSIEEMFTPEFMRHHTIFSSFDEMVAASPIAGTTLEQLAEDLQRPEWDAFVAEHSRFPSWADMLSAAAQEEARRRLS